MRLAALALLVALLAGCLNGPPAAAPPQGDGPRLQAPQFDASLATPTPLCHPATTCDFLMTPTEGRQGNEVTIAVNPTDPKNVVGGAKDYYAPDAGDCVWDGVYVTHDGAATPYHDRSFDGSPWRQRASPDPSKINYATQFWCTTDPVAYFDQQGTLYYVLMAYQTDPVTGSKTCKDECQPPDAVCDASPFCPTGGLNDWAFNRATQIVAISHDGGDTFDTFTPVEEGAFPVNFHDKAWIAAQNDGSVIHIVWVSALAGGNQYWRSVDGGKTYQDPQIFATTATGAGQGSFVDVGPAEQVFVAWESGGEHLVRSTDGGKTWDAPRKVLDINKSKVEGLSDRDRRNTEPSMATDRSADSPFADAVYFVWASALGDDDAGDILFSASHDDGETFGAPIRLNDDAGHAAQYIPAVSVSPGGVIDVTWMDERRADGRIDQCYTYSLDGGKTWAPNLRVRDADDQGWDPSLSHHQDGKIFIGDYLDIDSSWQAAHPVWPDTRDGEGVKVYTATIVRPMFAVGFPEAKKADVEKWVAEHPLS